MMNFTKIIKKEFPEYIAKSKEFYITEYDFWTKKEYENNKNFIDLRSRRQDQTKHRNNILNLYKQINPHQSIDDFTKEEEDTLYDAFLCTMVWGNIGLGRSKIEYFNSVFNYDKEKLLNKLKRVWVLLSKNDTEKAFISMKNIRKTEVKYDKETKEKDNNYIYGVGPAFFTKFIYFSGKALYDKNIPLIYDSVMARTHRAILISESKDRTVNNHNVHDYDEYIQLMQCISTELELPSPDYLEALLFSKNKSGGRQFIINYVKNNYPAANKKDTTNNFNSNSFWNKAQKEIPYPLSGIQKGYREIKEIFNSSTKILLQVYQKKINKHGYLAFGIHNIKKNQREELIKKLRNIFKEDPVEDKNCIIIRNTNPEYVNEDKKIEWFAENIQKIIDII